MGDARISRAWNCVKGEQRLDAAIDEMNDRYFVVSLGGRSVIASLVFDDGLDRERLAFSRPADLKLLYNHRHYVVGSTRQNREVWKDLGTAWIEHPRRRTFRQIALIPNGLVPSDTFNLWRGFGVQPGPGNWATLLQHLREVICSHNEMHLEWLLGWLAYCVQHPERQAEVAVVLRGRKGTGKGMIGQMLMRIFRNHALHITNSRHLVGNFNSHLADALFLFLDEAYWGGDRQGEGVLKGLITERAIMIEPKGVDAFPLPNRLKILMASNADWVVPASADERRYLILDVSDRKRGDQDYFRRLHEAIEGPELGAMLHHLLTRDLSCWNHRAPPHTAALNEQKLLGADSVTRYWHDCLFSGCIVGSGLGSDWPEDIVIQVLYAAYVDHAHDHGDRHPATINHMSTRLRELCPDKMLKVIRPNKEWAGDPRPRRYVLRCLEAHRHSFVEAMSIDPSALQWPNVECDE